MSQNKQQAKEIVTELEGRFLDGEKMTVDQIVQEYFKSTSTVNYLLGKQKVAGWITTLKKRFRNIHQRWFGNLNDLGEYGLPETEGEYWYSLNRYFKFVKGNIIRASGLKTEAVAKGLMLENTRDVTFLLPEPINEEDEA